MEILLALIVSISLLFGFLVLFENIKNLNNRLFFGLTILSSFWTFANFQIHLNPSLLWFKLSYSFGALLISVSLLWTLSITGYKLKKNHFIITILGALFYFELPFAPNFLPSYFISLSDKTYINHPDINYWLILYTVFYFVMSLSILARLYFVSCREKIYTKKRLYKLIFIGALIPLVTTSFNSFIFPALHIYLSKGIDSMGFICFLIIVVRSILKYELYKFRHIAIQGVIFILWSFILMRIFLATNFQDFFTNTLIFICSLIMGMILINSLFLSIRLRNNVKELSNYLEKEP